MDKLVVLAFFLTHFFSFPPGYFVNGANSVSITSCAQTPYPDVCNHYIGNNVNVAAQLGQTRFSFRDLAIQVTLNQAFHAHRLISLIDSSSFDERAKLAWNDCLELYEDTVHHLNQSKSTNNPIDSQTWLSAAIANQQTCQNGFLDFNLASHLQTLPAMLGNFTKLISNSLAINKATLAASSSSHSNFAKQVGNRRLLSDGFPAWLSTVDRKLLRTAGAPKADIVVAQDGSGNFKTITKAVAAAGGGKRTVIHVKAGVYRENVDIKRSAKNIMLIGDGVDATIVTGSKNAQTTTTFRSATVGVSGDGFVARDITFENTAGPQKHQAVALRSSSDFSVFYRCSFKGYQDTLYVYSQRQFYRDCDIYGTVDFIFGDAVAVLQNCNIYIRRPMSGQKNTVTAQGRTDPNENTGIVIHNSRVTAAADMRAVQGSFKSYLGRPWKKYSRTVFMKSTLDGLIDREGWLPWSGGFALRTLYYAEYMNTGAGASTVGRVKWRGYHIISAVQARKFTVGNFLAGSAWIPGTGVPFDAGL
ncbi:putative pectinesterase/pectinesterase inhibitor 6 [Hibiscus syriacus]|uniref:Pectinesterase n=1 Tax=Hibiscus syriacus TaxID=106335 RepID=A0A6A2XDM7_HIBSY|nr:pectinesterase-like [Hibiscus syriacus]KAE8667720.1 putative pectinesterase/pectinesterase inhibitor 6 [Hibiscus syriacus]